MEIANQSKNKNLKTRIKKIIKFFFIVIFGKTKKLDFNLVPESAIPKLASKLPWVSFVIPARNEEKSIGNCINAIINDNYPKTEIIIVDDVSADNTVNIVRQFQSKVNNKRLQVKLIRNKKRLGPAPCRNIGFDNSKGEFIIMFDAHSIIASKNYTRNYLRYFADKKVGAVAGGREWTPKYYQDKVLFYAGGIRPWREMGFKFLDNPNSAYRRSVYIEMGKIDEKLIWGSDLSTTFKILNLGYTIPSAPGSKVTIDHSVTPNRRIDVVRKPFLYGTNFCETLVPYFKLVWKRKVDLRIVIGGVINLSAIAIFIIYPKLWWVPLITVGLFRLHSIAYAVYTKAPLKYIAGIPFVLTISEMSYALGFLYGSIRKSLGLQSFRYS